jgi:glycosyltransferase involved in cell wall biosynthesis
MYLVGHIGHFTEPKNHFFLIDVFAQFHKLEPKSKLLLISDGPRFRQVQEQVAQLGMEDAVIFAGRRSDVAGIYSAMDLFMLPSCWEGLPLVLVEAQVNGLPMLVSDVVTKVAKCTDRLTYKALDDGPQSWARSMQELLQAPVDRLEDHRPAIAAKGFDIHAEAEKLRKLYLQD